MTVLRRTTSGVSIIEIARVDDKDKIKKKGEWEVIRPSKYARRITAQTPMKIGGTCRGRRQAQDRERSLDPRSRRFLTGPVRCEITGLFTTPDERMMFVGIQHPGEPNTSPANGPAHTSSSSDPPHDPANPQQFSKWPDGDAGGRPRSSCIVITKDDGGEIGS